MQHKLRYTENAFDEYRRKVENKKDDAAMQVRNLEILLSKREHQKRVLAGDVARKQRELSSIRAGDFGTIQLDEAPEIRIAREGADEAEKQLVHAQSELEAARVAW